MNNKNRDSSKCTALITWGEGQTTLTEAYWDGSLWIVGGDKPEAVTDLGGIIEIFAGPTIKYFEPTKK